MFKRIFKRTKKIMVMASVPATVVLIGLGIAGRVSLVEACLYAFMIDGVCAFVMCREPSLFFKIKFSNN